MPRAIREQQVESGDQRSESHFDLPTTGDIVRPGPEPIMTGEAVAAAGQEGYYAMLAFMEERVGVVVGETTDANAEPMPAVYVNGVAQYCPRGVEVSCRRKFVEGLVRAKPVSVRTSVEERNSENPANRIVRTALLKYPFQVTRDDNPRGAAWLRALLAEDMVR
jgi:hypothetical protein